MDPTERRRLVSDYVKDRLIRECRGTWGKAIGVSRRTGFSTAHITNVMKGNRATGDDFAVAIARYWGMTYAELERLAVERAATAYASAQGNNHDVPPRIGPSIATSESLDLHPSLTEAVGYCRARGVYPLTYLEEYETEARRLPEDRPRDVWMADLRVKFWEWQQSARRFRAAERSELTGRASLGTQQDQNRSAKSSDEDDLGDTGAQDMIGAGEKRQVTSKSARKPTHRVKDKKEPPMLGAAERSGVRAKTGAIVPTRVAKSR